MTTILHMVWTLVRWLLLCGGIIVTIFVILEGVAALRRVWRHRRPTVRYGYMTRGHRGYDAEPVVQLRALTQRGVIELLTSERKYLDAVRASREVMR